MHDRAIGKMTPPPDKYVAATSNQRLTQVNAPVRG